MGDALMLGVSGLRGIVGTSLTADLALRFAATVGTWVAAAHRARPDTPRPVVVLGRDGRAGGGMIRAAASAGLLSAGCDVLDLDVAMTPTVGVVTDAARAAAGMVITASHNPQEWNGIKILWGGRRRTGTPKGAAAAAPSKATAGEIISLFRGDGPRPAAWDGLGQYKSDRLSGRLALQHLDRVLDTLRQIDGRLPGRIRKHAPHALVDSVNASGSDLSSHLLGALGVKFSNIAAGESGLFPHTPEPIEANLGGLCRAVKRARAGVGFAQDPDGDRLALIDERGRFIGEEYTLVLATSALCELGVIRRGSTLSVNLSTSRMIDDLARRHRLTVARTPVGEANVVEAMKARRSPIGGEGNGGVIWPAITYVRDSLGAMALVLSLMALTRKPLSELVGEMPAYAIVKRKVDLARPDDARPAIEKVAHAYRLERVDRQDGVRVDLEARSAWVHVRASNTEPIMRLIAEAPTRQQATALLDEVAGVIAGS
ncbi:MAG: phosphoglucosamine mutase [Phycisphaerales bacterium]